MGAELCVRLGTPTPVRPCPQLPHMSCSFPSALPHVAVPPKETQERQALGGLVPRKTEAGNNLTSL